MNFTRINNRTDAYHIQNTCMSILINVCDSSEVLEHRGPICERQTKLYVWRESRRISEGF